eukprot:2698694-Alexandrium_andersonii.AAC.1
MKRTHAHWCCSRARGMPGHACIAEINFMLKPGTACSGSWPGVAGRAWDSEISRITHGGAGHCAP